MTDANLLVTTDVHALLQVTTNLTTEHVKGTVREGDGKRLDNQGYSRWVGQMPCIYRRLWHQDEMWM